MPGRIRSIIVDDEPLARRGLELRLHAFADFEIVAQCANGREAVDAVAEHAPDLMFLDIEMPGIDGFEVLRRVPQTSMPMVVFVTAFDQFAVRAFEIHALDYLLKPFDRERFEAAWQRAKSVISSDRFERRDQRILALLESLKAEQRYLERLVVKVGGRVFFLDVNEIDCIQAEGNYVRVHSGPKSYLLRATISGLEAQLDPRVFLRIHRSAIVKLDRIKELQPWFHGEYHVILHTGQKLTLSRNYRANLQEAIGNTL